MPKPTEPLDLAGMAADALRVGDASFAEMERSSGYELAECTLRLTHGVTTLLAELHQLREQVKRVRATCEKELGEPWSEETEAVARHILRALKGRS